MSIETGLFWFRRDLRLTDNRGLRRARDRVDRLFAVFVVDPNHSSWAHSCGDRFNFKMQAVKSLRQKIRDRGGELYIRRGKHRKQLKKLAKKLKIDYLFYNNCYEPYERQRDERVNSALEEPGVEVKTCKDQVIHEKKEILTNNKTPYKVFGYYKKKWKEREKPGPVASVQDIEANKEVEPGDIPAAGQVGLGINLENAGRDPYRQAELLRDEFMGDKIVNYEKNRDFPARRGTSRLSPYLRFGLLSPRTLYHQAKNLKEEVEETAGAETFIEELIWRDFYHQLLYNFPEVAEENFKSDFDSVEWEENEEWFRAWREGQTGYPIVDSAMRQLNKTGWMHNRLRMISAMFLTKDLLLHWKKGEKYFMNRLLDGDTAANNGGWQWSASTGADAAPYFRIFNPVTQSRKYDPEGKFIRAHCPELEGLKGDVLHAPFAASKEELDRAGVNLGENYPQPIVDHAERREIAKERFKRAKED
ncbi:MAG: cryptochrome/photolyase family protein [bacterium]